MGPTRTRVLRAAGVLCALVLTVGAPGASGASRPDPARRQETPARLGARSRAAIPAVDTVQLGPIPARDGFTMYVTDVGCGSSDPSFQVAFLAGRSADRLTHTYTGLDASCTIASSPAGAQLRASLPGALDITAQIATLGRPLAHPGLPVGCGAPFGPELPALATGRIDVAIHTGVFGRLDNHKVNAQIFTGAHQQCPAVQPSSGRELTADLGADILDASAPVHGTPELDIYDGAGDISAAGLTGTLELALSGSRVYTLTGPAGSARIAPGGPFASGSLAFTALAACPGASAVNGTMTGSVTINDPLLGPLVIRGSDATLAYTGPGNARAGGCNGPGSQPVEPALLSNCSVDGSCSVQAATNTVTFSDETDPGTQTISSEQLDFGDGSSPIPLAPGGVVTHSYAGAGVYVATLTVVDAAGVTSTASTDVYVDP